MDARFRAARVGQGMCVVTGERQAAAETALVPEFGEPGPTN